MKRKRLRKFMVRKLSLLVFLVGTLFVSLISISYALVNARITGVTHYSVKIGTLAFKIEDEKNAIRLLNAYPMKDDEGKTLKPYTFTLTNTGTLKEYYRISILEDTEEKEACINCEFLSPDKIRYSLKANGVEGEVRFLNSSTTVIEVGELAKNETKNYELRLWLEEEATIDEEDKFYYGKLQVEASQEPYENYETKPNPPELGKNMLPIVYDETANDNNGGWKVADIDDGWYDYSKQEWANAVTVVADARDNYFDEDGDLLDDAVGKVVLEDNINTWWVWIPRYSYTIKSEDNGTSYYGKKLKAEDSNPTASLPGAIDIKFIDKYKTDAGTAQYTDVATIDETWRTPDGFRFGDQRVSGIWVGKFELSHSSLSENASDSNKNSLNCTSENCVNADGIEILPNKVSLRWNNIANFFYAIKSMQRSGNPFGFETDQNNVDVHMMKNSEWGVVAYLSQSKYGKYGNNTYLTSTDKEVKINNCENYKTGIGANDQNANQDSSICDNSENKYDGEDGKSASTTGNITGVYDMSGGAWEFVMGALKDESNKPLIKSSGFVTEGETNQIPDAKYYDLYEVEDIATVCEGTCYGHALSETSGWYNDDATFVSSSYPWLYRGGHYNGTSNPGVFAFSYNDGFSTSHNSSRAVLISF